MIKKSNYDEILQISKKLPASQYYIDKLSLKDNQSIGTIEFFQYENLGFLALSKNKIINIYSTSAIVSKALLVFCNDICTPRVIYADFFLKEAIDHIFSSKIKKYNPYFYLSLSTPKAFPILDEMAFRMVKDNHEQTELDEWHKEFRGSSESNGSLFKYSSFDHPSFYLFFINDILLGGLSNTLFIQGKFWVGRFTVFQKFRSKGYGKAILNIIETAASLSKQSIHCLVNSKNDKALSFFKKRNYKKISENAFWIIGQEDHET